MSRTRDSGNAQEWIISNEFAQVRLTIDRRGNDPRLRIEDMTTDVSTCYWVPAGRDSAAPPKPQRKQKSAAPRLSPRKDALLRHSPCPETDT